MTDPKPPLEREEWGGPRSRGSVMRTSPLPASSRMRMSIGVALDLALCGVLVVGLSYLARRMQPTLLAPTSWAGWVGGALCVLWAVMGRRGIHCHRPTLITLAAAACVFSYQAVKSWRDYASTEPNGRMVTAIMFILVVFCVGMVANLIQEQNGPPG